MRKEEVRDEFLRLLAEHLPGFRPRKKEYTLVRKVPGGWQAVGLGLVDRNPEFTASLVITTRIDEVERIAHAIHQTPPRYQPITVTTATLLEYFLPGKARKEFKVTSPQEIESAVSEVAPHLRDRILPFLDAHQDVRALDAVMNSDEGASFDRTTPPDRHMKSLILAHLAGNPRFAELAARYAKEAESWHPDDRAKLSALVRYLETHRA